MTSSVYRLAFEIRRLNAAGWPPDDILPRVVAGVEHADMIRSLSDEELRTKFNIDAAG